MSLLRTTRQQEKQTRIEQAALELFITQGFEATTIRQIAQRAEVAPGTLFLYAADKGDLLIMVFHNAIQHTVDEGWSLTRSEDTPTQIVSQLFRKLFEIYLPWQAIAQDFIRLVMFHPSPWQKRELDQAKHFVQRLAEFLHEQQVSGRLHHRADPDRLALTLFTLYQGALVQWLSGHRQRQDVEQLLDLQIQDLLGRQSP